MEALTSVRKRVRRTLAEGVYDNPVVTKELRTRMRGWKAFILMGCYVLFLAAVLLIAYYSLWMAYSHYPMPHAASRNLGQHLFMALTWTQAILLCLIVPALTSGALSLELEKKTIEMLALSRLTPGRIVAGKQLSAFLYSLVLLVSSLPLSGICLMFGGISPSEVGITYGILVSWAFLLAALGVFWSALFSRTAASALLAYGTSGMYMLFISGCCGETMAYSPGSSTTSAISALSPGFVPMCAWMNATVCGISLSAAGIAFALNTAMGILLLLIATTHVRHKKAERALPIRLLAVGITMALAWLLLGDESLALLASSSPSNLGDLLGMVGTVVLAFLGSAAPILTTGPIRRAPGTSLLRYALSLRKTFKNDLGGGISFMLLWSALLYGACGGTILWAAEAYLVKVPHTLWISYFKLGIVILAVIAATSAVGILASSFVRNRGGAAALVALFVVLIFAGYGAVLASYRIGVSNPGNPVWQLAALWPMTPFITEMGEWSSSMPPLEWGKQNSWLVVGIVYLAMAGGILALASRTAGKFPGVEEE